ncbi:MAG: hypothetical protein ABWY04_17180 [Arthrobacter sp.]
MRNLAQSGSSTRQTEDKGVDSVHTFMRATTKARKRDPAGGPPRVPKPVSRTGSWDSMPVFPEEVSAHPEFRAAAAAGVRELVSSVG